MGTRRQTSGLVDVRGAARIMYDADDAKAESIAMRRVYKQIESGHLPANIMLRIGKRIWFRTGPLRRWIGEGDGATKE